MSYCLNPACSQPQNPPPNRFCQTCGAKLRLRDRYRALKPLGEGGFGRTFLAVDEDKPSQPHCVIKQFFPQAQGTENIRKATELFDREAVRLEELGKHPQIPELMAYFTEDRRQYLVQEFIDGRNLEQVLDEEGIFTESDIRQLLDDLLPVLQFIHDRRVIHRDVKPENIIRKFSKTGGRSGNLVLVDFGAAKFSNPTSKTVTGTVIGSAGYAAPEQALGKASFASDIYSLGVTCICLLTGVEPFNLYSVADGDWIWRDFLTVSVSDELGKILDKMLATATKLRYSSAADILRDLHPPASPQPPPSVPKQYRTEAVSKKRDRVWNCALTLRGHTGSVLSVSLSGNGRILASGSADGTIKLWQLPEGLLLRTIVSSSSVGAVDLTRDGQLLVNGNYFNAVEFWPVNEGLADRIFEGLKTLFLGNPNSGSRRRTLREHKNSVQSIAIHPQGQIVASGSDDKTVKLWRLDTGQEMFSLRGHSGLLAGVKAVAFSPDGDILASASDDTTICLWEVRTGKQLRVLQGHTKSVRAIAFSPDGTMLASGSTDTTVRLWDTRTGAELQTFNGHQKRVNAVAFSPDGRYLASGSRDGTPILWRLSDGTAIDRLGGHTGAVNALTFDRAGTMLVGACDRTVVVWQ